MFSKRLIVGSFLIGCLVLLAEESFIEQPKQKKKSSHTKEEIVDQLEDIAHELTYSIEQDAAELRHVFRNIRAIGEGDSNSIIGKGSKEELDQCWENLMHIKKNFETRKTQSKNRHKFLCKNSSF